MTGRGHPRSWPEPRPLPPRVRRALAVLWTRLPIPLGLGALVLAVVLGGRAGDLPLVLAVLLVGALVALELWWNAWSRRRPPGRPPDGR